MSTNKSIIKSTYLISLGTVISRVLGLLRDIVIAKFFGTTIAAEAFVVAFRIPNLFRNLVGEGSTNAAVVPVLSEYIVKKDNKNFILLTNIAFYWSLIILCLIAVLGIILSPYLVRIIAPGFLHTQTSALELTVALTRIIFPYLVLIGLTAYSMGVLFSLNSFFAPAFAPTLLNISIIFGAIFGVALFKQPIYGLAIGVLIGGALQLAIQIPFLFKKGFRFVRISKLSHPGLKSIGNLLLPRIFGSAIYQLNIFVDTICASLWFIVGSGAIAAIYYANRIIQFPLAIFGIALASASLPTMSRLAAENNLAELKNIVSFSLRKILLVMIPSTIGLVVLSEPIIKVFFQRGEFGYSSTIITASALMFYAVGLSAFGGVKILTSCFYALKDTRTPVKIAGICLALNILLNLILMFPLKVGGLALASSISSLVNFSILAYILSQKIGRYIKDDFISYLMKVMMVSLCMGLAVFITWYKFLLDSNIVLRLASSVISGIFVFVLGCFIFRIRDIKELFSWTSKIN